MTDPDSPIRVAIDVGPLYGHRTGVGVATAGMVAALDVSDQVVLDPYLVSFRSSPLAGHRKLPLPGVVASHVWARVDRPRADRWLRGVEVVHGTNYVVPPTRLPTVVSIYDCWFLEHPDLAAPVVRRAGRRLRRAVAAGAFVHASSEATAAQARALLDTDRVVAIPLGPPPAAPASGGRVEAPPIMRRVTRAPYVLAIGTEEHRKDLPLLIAAFAQIAAAHDELRLILAGAGGDASADVAAAIAGLPNPIADRVDRLGPIDDATKQSLLRQASVLAYPSLDEGFGFPLLEAHAAGTPVVANDVGSIGEVAGGAALLVKGRDPTAFATALERAIDDGALRLGLIEAGHRNVRRFDWNATARGLIELYRRAIGEAP